MTKITDKILKNLEPYFLPDGTAWLTYTDGAGFYILKTSFATASAVRATRTGDASRPMTADQVVAVKNECRTGGRRFASFGAFMAKTDERRSK